MKRTLLIAELPREAGPLPGPPEPPDHFRPRPFPPPKPKMARRRFARLGMYR